jgi:hypothetical protein
MSEAYYRDFLPPTHMVVLSGRRPRIQRAPPERRVYLLLHTLGQAVKACARSKITYAGDYLGRARTTFLLMRCQTDDADGMRRSTFRPEIERRLLPGLAPIPLTADGIMREVASLLEIATTTYREHAELFSLFRRSYRKHGLP